MRNTALYTAVVLMLLGAGQAGAAPLTLTIDYPGIGPNAENEISSFTFDNGSASFDHLLSNISPQLLQLTTLGTTLANLTVTASDGAVSLGSLVFEDVVFTSVVHSGLTEQVSFAFPPAAGFYRIDYPGIAPTAENEISSLTLTPSSVTFEHQISNISPQLLLLTAGGTDLATVTFTQDAGSFFGNVALGDAIFTSVTHPGADLREDATLVFDSLQISTPAPVTEPASIVLLGGGVATLVGARRRRRLTRALTPRA